MSGRPQTNRSHLAYQRLSLKGAAMRLVDFPFPGRPELNGAVCAVLLMVMLIGLLVLATVLLERTNPVPASWQPSRRAVEWAQ
jgi:hypothetical protein